MNDIRLISTDDGRYDWNFTNGDIDNVIGDQQIISSVMHTVLLRKNELEQLYYQDKGSPLWEYAGVLNYEKQAELIKLDIEHLCKTLPEVFDANVSISQDTSTITINHIQITKKDGGVLNIGI